MRYPDGGGLTERGRAKREQVRRQASGWFAEGVPVPQIAARLRVSKTAVYGWRSSGGPAAYRRWPRKARPVVGVVSTMPDCGALSRRWTKGPPYRGSAWINVGPWRGCRT